VRRTASAPVDGIVRATLSGVIGAIRGYGARMTLHVDPAELAGRLARDAHGRPLGEVETVFEDKDEGGSRFVGIDTDEGRVVVPVDGAEIDPTVYAIDLPYMVDRINGAPTIAPDVVDLDAETERKVAEHFGIEPQRKERPIRPVPEPTTPMEPPVVEAEPAEPEPPEEEVVLAEEQLLVDTQRVPAQRVRLRKEIVTEEVTVTVVLRHEELVIEREPIEPGGPPPESADAPKLEEPMEIVLWAEEPVVTTRAVPAERVRVVRTLGSQQQDLTAQLRRERASFDHAPGDEPQ
jgi:uncharacterized protein (TIGR02271 family)